MSEIQNNWKPRTVLSVKIIEHKDLKFGWFSGSKPFVTVNCPWLEKKQKYSTLVKHKPTAVVNETFRFVIPDYLLREEQTVEITVLDQGRIWNGTLATFVFNAFSLEMGNTLSKTFVIDKEGGELFVEFLKDVREKPNYRLSTDICEEEKEFRKRRMPKVKDAIEAVLKSSRFNFEPNMDFDLDQTPVISVVGSGGGYRAAIGMSGGMAALKDAGVLDTLTYAAGLSGSSWYLCSAYAQDGVRNETQDEYHKWLQRQMENSVYWTASGTLSDSKFSEFSSLKEAHCQPNGLVDRFGYAVGKNLLGDKISHTMSQIRKQVSSGEVPYPLLTSAHFKGDVGSDKFRVHIENTPHEISMPRFGFNVATKHFGSHWDEGVITRECPEFPLHYYLGSCGCAFSVLLNSFVQSGSEADPKLLAWINEMRNQEYTPHAFTMAHESRQIETKTLEEKGPNIAKMPAIPGGIVYNVKKMVTDRTYLFDRTSEVNNVVHNLKEELPSVYDELSYTSCPEFQKIVEELGTRYQKDIDRERPYLSVCDAGIVQNVNVESFLRKPRFSDLIIVFDSNGYKSDDFFDYKPIIQSAVHAARNGLPFPNIQIKRLVHEPPTRFLAFEGETDDCPTILWFTLCNKNFKEMEHYEPKIPYNESKNKGRPFNDFPVYSSGTHYGTSELKYSKLHFQQLHELMYHNVTSCMPYIKHHIRKAVARKMRKVERDRLNGQ